MQNREHQIRVEERNRVLNLVALGLASGMDDNVIYGMVYGGASVEASLPRFEEHALANRCSRRLAEAVDRLRLDVDVADVRPSNSSGPAEAKPSLMDRAAAAWAADRHGAIGTVRSTPRSMLTPSVTPSKRTVMEMACEAWKQRRGVLQVVR
jgi:hypothetical protein